MGHSVLVVPVGALEQYVRARWVHYDPAWVSTDPGFTHAHVTLLSPWYDAPSPAALRTVADVAGSVDPFDFDLARVAAFPNGIIHTPPEPAAPFQALTEALVAAFEDCIPYDGAFGDPADLVPHLTLDHALGGVTPDRVRVDLGDLLPVRCRAETIEWHWYGEGECRVQRVWALGGSRALRPA